ncbi:putative membrane protein [Dyadobacter sp. BE34]|uniref:Membrane protein n=1 Tax=Dyadobacter fermentans TaxID=94254 RepID=A0ABU1RA11_9BACT|nr:MULTISPECIES: DUF1345 domain-containing protein [Dyadobacter]MDR6809780.1 putative membrane protein [Dyadobacter fermentans]MDR7047505.1 putative membrane protein [Dyadobacter sp. BE242]MDR7201675.1 putative membrane protein [Dyadobacter sp. BE34]MDR7219545.1 putative membrane protein [Dyadobacter sp. BE31]MDR7267332.1 putative membrane protein [Dyadobacter sp. BE32]
MQIISFINKLDAHYKLAISLFVAIIAIVITSFFVERPLNWMFAWLAYSVTHLGLAWTTILSSHPSDVRHEVHQQDSSRAIIFLFVVSASFVSLLAVLFLLQDARKNASWSELTGHVLLTFACIIFSWVLIHTIFTLRYAHLFYCNIEDDQDGRNQQPSGVDFPNETEPDYLDFTYFAFVIGMTFQVSDVSITSKEIRRLALIHGVLSFAFNTLLVALTINIISGLIQSKG